MSALYTALSTIKDLILINHWVDYLQSNTYVLLLSFLVVKLWQKEMTLMELNYSNAKHSSSCLIQLEYRYQRKLNGGCEMSDFFCDKCTAMAF